MIIYLNKSILNLKECTLSEEELVDLQSAGKVVILLKGIGDFINNPFARVKLLNEQGVDGELYIIIPSKLAGNEIIFNNIKTDSLELESSTNYLNSSKVELIDEIEVR